MTGFQFSNPASLDLSVIIVSFNTKSLLLDCLKSVYDFTEGLSFEVIVVDNASDDGSLEAVTKSFPRTVRLANSENHGFSAGINTGVKISKGRYVIVLNSDTVLIENAFFKLARFMDNHPYYDIGSPQIVDAEGKACSMRLWQDTPMEALMRILGQYDVEGEPAKMEKIGSREVETLGGSCLIVRRLVFETIGLFDESFFLYNEEDDFCRRARENSFKVCYYPETNVKHLHGKSTHLPEYRERVILETYKSYTTFYRKYYCWHWQALLGTAYKIVFAIGALSSFFKIYILRHSKTPDNSIRLKLRLLFMRVH